MAFGRLMNDALRRNVELVPPDQNGLHDLLFRRRPMGAWLAVEIQIGIVGCRAYSQICLSNLRAAEPTSGRCLRPSQARPVKQNARL